MIVQKEFLSKLKDFGLNSYEAKLWTALLSRGVSTAGELSDIASVPRSRSYDVLESLERKGFIIMKLGKPIKYIAVPPEEVIERVKKKVNEDANKQTEMLSKIKESDLIGQLNTLHSQGIDLVEPSELTASLKGRNNLYNHLDLMIRSASESVVMMTTASGMLRKLDILKPSIEKAAKRGVTFRIAGPVSKDAEQLAATIKGLELRESKDIKSRFVLIDGKEVAFMLMNDEEVHPSYDVGIWINSPFFANSLLGMFDMVWKNLKKR
jgi:HTH-type transcriptional regulator, sugar sensing transcriptional regulator